DGIHLTQLYYGVARLTYFSKELFEKNKTLPKNKHLLHVREAKNPKQNTTLNLDNQDKQPEISPIP
ncbi:MAG: hypothetical protein DRP73_03185, partial [Candidatus Omnitrophota bacterium]